MSTLFDDGCLSDLLRVYYKRLFPSALFCRWLSSSSAVFKPMLHREFSFTLQNDIYLRYLSFSDATDLMKSLVDKTPVKIDIGAVYTLPPHERKLAPIGSFQAVERELVFDIDITDYDDVRYCCSGTSVCEKCFVLMRIAIEIISDILSVDFGFEHFIWVFSGRRGVHCWVSDSSAVKMNTPCRSALAEYMSVVKGGDGVLRKVSLPSHQQQHPLIRTAVKKVEPHFIQYAIGQDLWDVSGRPFEDFLRLLPDDIELRNSVTKAVSHSKNDENIWPAVKSVLSKFESKTVYSLDSEVLLHYCYPRLDVNVTTQLNHLLKAPFCVHPKTGNICIPIDHNNLERFKLARVPTISKLCCELDSFEKSDDVSQTKPSNFKEYKLTSLKQSVELFTRFVDNLQSSKPLKPIQISDQKLEF